MEHELERKIILKLIHTPTAGFNELWGREGESNTFAYHLGKLEGKGLVAKNKDGLYQLTEEGRKLSAFIEGDTGKRADFPTFCHVILVQDGDKWLSQKRLKEPFFGYWGFVSGKINFGQNLFECATRDLLEEAGLHATKWQLKAIEQVKTYECGKLLHHHYLFHVFTDKFTGTLKEKTHKAEHEWLTHDEFDGKTSFPTDSTKKKIFNAKTPMLIEAERHMENGKFTKYKTLNVKEL